MILFRNQDSRAPKKEDKKMKGIKASTAQEGEK
jgi:hypothetical protein